jgi:serine/threonine protein kinase
MMQPYYICPALPVTNRPVRVLPVGMTMRTFAKFVFAIYCTLDISMATACASCAGNTVSRFRCQWIRFLPFLSCISVRTRIPDSSLVPPAGTQPFHPLRFACHKRHAMFQGVWTRGLTWSSRSSSASHRHKTDYNFLQEIGSGGFGRVFRVQHKLDGKEYALKVVRTSSSAMEMEKILREVQVLSSIQSEHIVRYYSAWIEPGDLSQIRGDWSSDEGASLEWPSSTQSEATPTTERKQSDPLCNLCQSTYTDWEVTLEQWGLIDAVLQPLDLCVDCYKKSIPVDVDVSNISIRKQSKALPDCLYILMEYCESTLSEAVAEIRSNGSGDAAVWSLFGQVLEGFAHLHANGIIHRDVKPSNIFVHNYNAKIGDLGLATTFFMSASGTPLVGRASHGAEDDHSVLPSCDVGTFLYVAPEVSAGKYYDAKSDIYSLGVVLVEIFHSFSTGMERAKVLGDLRQGIFPSEWKVTHPVAYDIARPMLLSEDPNARPSCFAILQDLQRRGLYQENSTKDCISDLQSQVRTLQERVEIQNHEISRLRRLLEANNVRCDDG